MSRNLLWISLIFGFTATAQAEEIALRGQQFTLPEGFTLEVAAAPPLVERPIAADFDDSGRLYVTESSGSNDKVEVQLRERPHRVLRLEDTDGDGKFDRRTVFADQLMLPQGALWYDGSLYVAAPPSIWKLTDTDNDGVADKRVEWFAGKTLTGCANDLHGPYLGRDGWIYWCKGAFAEQTYDRPGRTPLVTRASHIFRARPDGTGIEAVMTGGMDNPVDIAFTATGERIFTTTFLQHPGGGRRDGLIHAIYGGVYGKSHGVLDGHPRTGELMPVLSHLGAAAPAGLTTYDSRVFGAEYQGNLFAALFNMHKVTRHALSAAGSGLHSRDEDFLVSDQLDFHPTDVLEDADGSLLVIDTGGWYKLCCPTSQLSKPDVLGAIYRVRRKDSQKIDDPHGTRVAWAQQTPAQLVKYLSDQRVAVQQRAMVELARPGTDAVAALRESLQVEAAPEVRQRTLWTLTRIGTAETLVALRDGLQDADASVRQVALAGVSLHRDPEAVSQLIALLDVKVPANNRRLAAEALGRIGDPAAVTALLKASETVANDDRALEHALVYALMEINQPKLTRAGLESNSLLAKRMALLALNAMPEGNLIAGEVTPHLHSEHLALRETAAWIVSRHADWGNALAEYLSRQLGKSNLANADRSTLQQQLTQFASTPAVAQLLADTATNQTTLHDARWLAWQVMAQANISAVPASWQQAVIKIADEKDEALLAVSVAAVSRWPVSKTPSPALTTMLLQLAQDSKHAPGVRIAALAAAVRSGDELSDSAVELLLGQLSSEADVATRGASVATLVKLKLSTAQLLRVVDVFARVGPLEANPLLVVFEKVDDDAVGRKLIATLQKSPASAALRADALARAIAKFSPSVQQSAQELFARLNVDTAQQRANLEALQTTLPAGDARRGLAVFHSRKAACFSCHALGYLGGNIGPDLTHVGRIRSKQDLLEAIVYPSASFVRSYEPVVVVMQDGTTHSGTVRSESAQELELATGPDKLMHLPRGEIEEITPGRVSVMPAGLDKQLSAQELADLLAFLQSAK